MSDITCNLYGLLKCLKSETCLGNLKNDCSNIKEELLSYSDDCNCTQLLNPAIDSLISTTRCYNVEQLKTALVCWVDVFIKDLLTNLNLLTNCEALGQNAYEKLEVNGPGESIFCRNIDDTLRKQHMAEIRHLNCQCRNLLN